MATPSPVLDKSYLCVYPAYINSRKTLAEGRRIAKAKCVENPTATEIRDVCLASNLKTVMENKLYCRELYRGDVTFRGRVRVQLKNPDNDPVNPQIPDKHALLLYLCDMIPKLKSRVQKSGGVVEQSQQKGKKSQKKRR